MPKIKKFLTLVLLLFLVAGLGSAAWMMNPYTGRYDYYEPASAAVLKDLSDVDNVAAVGTRGAIIYWHGGFWKALSRGTDDQVLTVDAATDLPSWATVAAATFLSLTDVPSDYTGQGGRIVRVNATPDGLEFTLESAIDHDGLTNYSVDKHVGEDHTVYHNLWVGYLAGEDLAIGGGTYNILIGEGAGQDITTGDSNIVVGHLAGDLMTQASYNILIGNEAGTNLGTTSNTDYNVFIGHAAGRDSVQYAEMNVFIGYQAGVSNTSGANNVYSGDWSGYFNQTGSQNVVIGSQAGYGVTANSYSANVIVGYQTAYSLTKARYNVFIGYQAAYSVTSGGEDDIGDDVIIGAEAAYNMLQGERNVIIGRKAGYKLTNDIGNVYIGFRAGYEMVGAYSNVIIGQMAGHGAVGADGDEMVIVGSNAGRYLTTGQYNVFVGHAAAQDQTTGSENVVIGTGAGFENETGNYNVVIGRYAGRGVTANSYSNNVFMGYQAAYSVTTGGYNVIVGQQAAEDLTAGARNIVIGYMAGEGWLDTENDLLVIDNTDTATPLIYGDFNADTLTINGELGVPTANGFYYGDFTTDTSWRTIRSGTKLSFQRRESSAWVEKGFFDESSFHAEHLHAMAIGGAAGSFVWQPGTTPDADPDGARLWVDNSGDLWLLEQNADPETRVQREIGFDGDYIRRDGTVSLLADWDVGDARKILGTIIGARSVAGLWLLDYTAGAGIVIADGGNVMIGKDLSVDGQANFGADTNQYEDIFWTWGDAADHAVIAQTAVAGTPNQPLIYIDDDRTGATADVTGEATIFIDSAGAYAFVVNTGEARFNADVSFIEDLDVSWTHSADRAVIAQIAVAGTEDVPLIAITDARTGVTADEESEATIFIDSEGTYALVINDGAFVANGAVNITGKLNVSTLLSGAAIGYNNTADALGAVALGYQTDASGMYSTSMGAETTASSQAATAMGFQTTASAPYSLAIGREIEVSGDYSVAIALADMDGLNVTQANIMAIVGGRVSIGTHTPAADALLDLTSTTKALIITRMTTAQRDALTEVNGMIVYNTTTFAFNFYENGSWVTK